MQCREQEGEWVMEVGQGLGWAVRCDLISVFSLAQNYGLEFGEPPWLADIMSRYHLTPPPS